IAKGGSQAERSRIDGRLRAPDRIRSPAPESTRRSTTGTPTLPLGAGSRRHLEGEAREGHVEDILRESLLHSDNAGRGDYDGRRGHADNATVEIDVVVRPEANRERENVQRLVRHVLNVSVQPHPPAIEVERWHVESSTWRYSISGSQWRLSWIADDVPCGFLRANGDIDPG